MMFGGGMGIGWGVGLGWIAMLLFSVFAIAGIVWLVLALGRTAQASAQERGSAASILAERYARGEIDSEEFKARSRAIEEVWR